MKRPAPGAPQSLNLRLPSGRVVARFLSEAQAAVRLRGDVTVLLTTDRRIRQLNRDFRGKDKTTDVLSFPAEAFIQDQEKFAGDLAVSVETARRQSAACGHSLGMEIKVLILHGLLHLAGYDHETDAGRMAGRERLLRRRLGLPVGLIERASPATGKATADPSPRSLRELAQDDKRIAKNEKRTARRRRP